ncbi:DegT/DnrJ/EryC1/StrS family aminotransferase [Aureliella helgolandensis]|nr:DegT/DnrJ/EryC1/StrS family aminotransferase [Aureliella helgolandensis]
MWKIPIAKVDISGSEEELVAAALKSTWISSYGEFVDQFESRFAEMCNTRYALSCTNGTVALHLALMGMGLQPGDEVIVPSMTYIATANAVRYCGATPVFVDVDPNNWCLSPDAFEAAITPKTRGVIPVHLLGHPADMDRINEIAAIHGLWVVEDAAEAPFALYKGREVGSLADAATFSFFGNKVFTSGEGGAVTFNQEQLHTRLKVLRGQGMDPKRRYYFPVVGYNYRMTNIACAILCGQLDRKESILQARREIYEQYDEQLLPIPGIRQQPAASWATPSPWMYSVVIEPEVFGFTRDEVIAYLAEAGIDSRPFFVPIHHLPPYRQCPVRGPMLHTDDLGENGIMLPTYNTLGKAEIEEVVGCIRDMRSKRALRLVA